MTTEPHIFMKYTDLVQKSRQVTQKAGNNVTRARSGPLR